ncbi:hypothetical protein [Streptomyces sp. 6-11-2]|uniref:hypothetical protein n=1 Tax=Streptomyces sp. 6-11-2 TaxID=2585753 RepID=UPI00116A8905|nr:hypothetical protein [Streptomyces sp. 6-11-2]GED89062.1 hypothetical protein TNCT6_61470 [Streptomyces sp. 6-11-2]
MSGVQAIRRQHQNVADKPFIAIRGSIRAWPLARLHCRGGAVPDRDPRELDTAAAKDLLRQVAASGRPAPLFVITGGDPFQRPDLLELIGYGEEAGVRVAVSPTGTPTLSELHLGTPGSAAQVAKMRRAAPDATVFNGVAAQYAKAPLKAKAGERARFWVVAAGPGDGHRLPHRRHRLRHGLRGGRPGDRPVPRPDRRRTVPGARSGGQVTPTLGASSAGHDRPWPGRGQAVGK